MLKKSAYFSLYTITMFWAGVSTATDLNSINISNSYAPPGTVSLGAVLRGGGSPYKGIDNISSILNDNQVDLLPLYLYEGDIFFARGTTAGAHLFRNNTLTIDALIDYRFDRLEVDSNDYFTGMNNRRQTVDGGLSAALEFDWGTVSTTVVNDLMGRHNGYEWDVSYQYPWRSGRLTMTPFVSYIYQDRDLVNYYFGVSANEALPDRPAYQPGSADFWRAGIGVSYQISPQLMAFSSIAIEQIDRKIQNSPLVDERHLGAAAIGFAYLFGNVLDDSSKQPGSARLGEWSWRVNTGYQAEGPFTRTHTGNLKRSEDAHAYMAGLTLGKLLTDGKYIDYWGRVSFNRRLENGHQSDFWEYNAYVMAMTQLRSSKTQRELFRYGLGFGFSYAASVPTVEKVKQTRRERETSHFLNYLEAQFDVPLNVIFGESASNNCYTGVTLIHRSGIFADSDILGNVSGGSDMVTFHVECKR